MPNGNQRRVLGQLSEHSIDVEPTANQCCEQNDNDDCTENALSALVPFPGFNRRLPILHL
jgi:hypothetical protein